jgi:hypothetical protein
MSNFLNKIPVSPITSFGNPSVPNGSTFGTNFSILQTGGYMEVYTLSGLTYTIPPATTGIIEFSGNSIPIQFTKGSGSVFSPDVLTLNSDNISSGRRKLGMLVYVYETNKIYQFRIDNYETLWNNATGATGPGGATVVISDFGTTIKNNSAAGIAFINAWTASTIEGVGGFNDTNSSWRVLKTDGLSITGGTFNDNTETLTLNNSTGGTITITGFTDVFVTGGTYTSGNAIFTNNTGGTFTVTGFAVGSGGGQLFYLNLSQSEGSNRLLSTTASTSPQQTSGVTISSGVTSSIASFQSPQLNTILIPGGVWSFHLHSYKEDTNSSFDIFVEVYKRTSGGTQTLLFQTEPTTVLTDSPLPSMQITEAYFSGTSLVVSDSIVTIVRATNTGNQSKIITLVTEGTTYYSYVVSSLPTQQGLTCDTLSGCSIIQTIQTNISNKFDKSGGTVTGPTNFIGGLTANTFSASTYLGLPIDIRVTGATKSGSVATFRNNTGGTFTLTGLTDTFVTGGTHSYTGGTTTFRNNTGGTFTVTGYFTPSNDIYVTSGVVDHGPNNGGDNNLQLTRSDLSTVTISNLVNISDTTKSNIDALIGDKKIIRGKTYKISGCDLELYYNGDDGKGGLIYTTIYLMGLEGDKLSETGVGIFYTPKYSDFTIFNTESLYGLGDKVIWGGYVWECTGAGQGIIDILTLNDAFEIIYPFESNIFNSTYYNIQYDDIIYDYDNDKIIYRNEQDTNIVQTSHENINYWEDVIGYNPIKVFQWGNVYSYSTNSGIGNQTIINSYNENINFNGVRQINFYFNNYSYQSNLLARGDSYQENFILTNKSYVVNMSLDGESYQNNIVLNNESYLDTINLSSASFQEHLTFDNKSYQQNITFAESTNYQRYFNFTNESYQNNINLLGDKWQRYFNFNQGSQTENNIITQEKINIENGSQTNIFEAQTNVTIKGYDLNWNTYPSVSPQINLFFINDLPTETTSRLIGKKENRLVEVSDFYYDGSKWVVDGTLSATTISATTYNGYVPLPTQASASTGVVLSFVTDTVYGSLLSPETGTTITANTTNALLGVTNILIHSGGTSPTFSSQYKKLSGSGNYTTGQVNYIFTTFITSTEIIYSINQRT